MTSKEKSKLVVVVSGGGPVGLTFALNVAMMICRKHIELVIYEQRWFTDQHGRIHWQNEQQGNIRRDQVVTLQDHVIQQLPLQIQQGLFTNINERVWPTSRNIPIKEVEDRLLDLIQPFVEIGQVKLIAEQFNELTQQLIDGEFDILVGADGSNSFVRRYCNIELMSEGIEYACGVAYHLPDDHTQISIEDRPLHQALNCILTICQTRYLVNSSSNYHGYLNVRLTRSEYEELCTCLQMFEHSHETLDLIDYKSYFQPSVWSILRQGLHFFNIHQKYVVRIVPIEINVRHASIVVRELHFQSKKTTKFGCLVGDAAMNVHFWPGRGMNTGMKSAMALARTIFRSFLHHRTLQFNDFIDYEGFMARLRAREQQGRSLRILNNPIDKTIEQAASTSHCLIKYTKQLEDKLKQTRFNLQQRSDWPHKTTPVTDEQLNQICRRISRETVAQLSLANPWPTREMSGIEIRVQDTFPFDHKRFLPIPQIHNITSSSSSSSQHTRVFQQHSRLVILIVLGQQQHFPSKLIDLIPNSIEYQTAHTLKQTQQWIRNQDNLQNIQRQSTRFKVITMWSLNEKHTAIDVIRTIRTKMSQTPFLIISQKHEETRLAHEFPNVTIANSLSDFVEFLGMNQPTQWNQGCAVSHKKNKQLLQ